jgi:hypothetical protein
MAQSPTSRSLDFMRNKRGFIATKVEQLIHMPKRPFPMKRDAFGFGDILCAKDSCGAYLIQVTSGTNLSHRINKIMGIVDGTSDEEKQAEYLKVRENALVWLKSGGRIFVHGWAKRGKRGERKKWTLRSCEVWWEEQTDLMRVREEVYGVVGKLEIPSAT